MEDIFAGAESVAVEGRSGSSGIWIGWVAAKMTGSIGGAVGPMGPDRGQGRRVIVGGNGVRGMGLACHAHVWEVISRD